MDIGVTNLEARFTTDIRVCTDNSTWTSVILQIFKQISARTVRPGLGDRRFREVILSALGRAARA